MPWLKLTPRCRQHTGPLLSPESRLTYATSVWWGSDDRRRIEGFLRRGIRAGFYLTGWPTVKNVEDADDDLFRRVLLLHNDNDVLHPLLPERNDHGYALRRRRHERTLTLNDDKRNFRPIYRQLHKYSY